MKLWSVTKMPFHWVSLNLPCLNWHVGASKFVDVWWSTQGQGTSLDSRHRAHDLQTPHGEQNLGVRGSRIHPLVFFRPPQIDDKETLRTFFWNQHSQTSHSHCFATSAFAAPAKRKMEQKNVIHQSQVYAKLQKVIACHWSSGEKNTCYIPFYCLVARDPRNGLL